MSFIKVAIIGAGELGEQILDLLNYTTKTYKAVGFFDDVCEVGKYINGVEVIGNLNNINTCYQKGMFDQIIIAIGYKHMEQRKNIFSNYYNKIPFAKLIHKSAIINCTAKIGDGVIIYPGCIIDRNVVINNNVFLNLGVTVAHDSEICSHSFIAPKVVFSGFVKVGECTFIGSGTVTVDNVNIGNNVIIGAGTVVIKDLSAYGKYVGNPARKI